MIDSRAHAAWAARLRRTASELWDAIPETFPPDWEQVEPLLGRLYVLADEMDPPLREEAP